MPDEVTLTFPRERDFHGVAHLVLGGLALRLKMTIESLEDLRLALDAVLDEAGDNGEVTVKMCLHGEVLETRIGPVSARPALEQDTNELGLRRVLDAVVDGVELDGEWVRLTKRVETHG